MASAKPGSIEQDRALTDLEQSLYSMENLDRSSPELWPEKCSKATAIIAPTTPVPGVANFLNSFTPPSATKMPYSKELTADDQDYLHQLAQLGTAGLISKVKELHDLAYRLGQEEAKEISRGKLLNLFSKSRRNK